MKAESRNRKYRFLGASVVAALAISSTAGAQTWPSRTVRVVAPFTPGGTVDLMARLLAEKLPAAIGTSAGFVVENRPGAAGNVGTDYVAKQPADGYTLLVHGSVAASAVFGQQLPYDPFKDFAPISQLAVTILVLATSASVPATNINELVAYARANPGKLTYASVGAGTPQHFASELLRQIAKIDIVHVPYKGGAQVVAALLAGDVGFSVNGANTVTPHAGGGKLRMIAVPMPTRSAYIPNVPTIAESLPAYDLPTSWLGLYAPAGTPRPIIDRLNQEANRIVTDPQIAKDRLFTIGLEPIGTTPEKHMEVIRSDLAKYVRIAKDGNIRPD